MMNFVSEIVFYLKIWQKVDPEQETGSLQASIAIWLDRQ